MKPDRDSISDADPTIPPKLAEDLRMLVQSRTFVPGDVDRAVLDQAKAHLVTIKPRRMRPNWSVTVAISAAAMILLGVLTWPAWFGNESELDQGRAARTHDINRDGDVNIVDALLLARHVHAGQSVGQPVDVNEDGAIDRADADAIAIQAVALVHWRQEGGL